MEEEQTINSYQDLLLENAFLIHLFTNIVTGLISPRDIIEFRATTYTDKNYFSPANFQFDLNQKILCDNSGRKELIDIKSETFHEIFSKVMYRMELKEHIHIYASGKRFQWNCRGLSLLFL